MYTLVIKVNGVELRATMYDNSSAEALRERIREVGVLPLHLEDYGNFEKVGELPFSLPRNDWQITTSPGDIILFLGTHFTIYYDVNSWDFTRMGRIENVSGPELKSILGSGDVDVELTVDPQ